MITEQDKIWLHSNFPGLLMTNQSVSGTIEFEATYNSETNKFLLLPLGSIDTVGGTRLSVKFDIQLQDRIDKSVSNLPGLFVKGVDLIPDRHFNQRGERVACLCSPFEEEEFLNPSLNFKLFFEELVIPFLYGQEYFSQKGNWPWDDYSHGALGLLEAYYKCANPINAKDCLQRLSREFFVFPEIKRALLKNLHLKGHYRCLCLKNNKMRHCHRIAWLGFNMLRKNIEEQNLAIPDDALWQKPQKVSHL